MRSINSDRIIKGRSVGSTVLYHNKSPLLAPENTGAGSNNIRKKVKIRTTDSNFCFIIEYHNRKVSFYFIDNVEFLCVM